MRRRPAKTWVLRVLLAVVVAGTVGYVPYRLYAHSGFFRYLDLRRELEALRARNEDLRGQNARLRREIEAIEEDPLALERAARLDLSMVRPGEVIFDLGPTP
jgi:cell division protein FtsB